VVARKMAKMLSFPAQAEKFAIIVGIKSVFLTLMVKEGVNNGK